MIAIALAACTLYAYRQHIQKCNESVIVMTAIVTAILNLPAQAILPGGAGLAGALLLATAAVLIITKGAESQ